MIYCLMNCLKLKLVYKEHNLKSIHNQSTTHTSVSVLKLVYKEHNLKSIHNDNNEIPISSKLKLVYKEHNLKSIHYYNISAFIFRFFMYFYSHSPKHCTKNSIISSLRSSDILRYLLLFLSEKKE
ncbi:MAG: hypothetical protein RJA25_186 [Bacteroidota bacterium]